MGNEKNVTGGVDKNLNLGVAASSPYSNPYENGEGLDDYMHYHDRFYYDEKCYSCRHWFAYDCESPQCNYEPI